MKLAYVELCGFRGYRTTFRVDFASAFTVVEGRNGVGKSTIFDAVEFALTGVLSKYKDATAAGESVADYIWWRGKGAPPTDRYVEVGFSTDAGLISVRRAQFVKPDPSALSAIAEQLVDVRTAPEAPLAQLCSAAIIRDEHIAGLSLDLKETERYALLRSALGASDSDVWVDRAARILALTKQRALSAQQEATRANADVGLAARRIDEVRARLAGDAVIAEAASRLRILSGTEGAPDQLIGPSRGAIAKLQAEVEYGEGLLAEWARYDAHLENIPSFRRRVEEAQVTVGEAAARLAAVASSGEAANASELSAKARSLAELVERGRGVGLNEGHCPLCNTSLTVDEFQRGMHSVSALAAALDTHAANAAVQEAARARYALEVRNAQSALEVASKALQEADTYVIQFEAQRARLGLKVATRGELIALIAEQRAKIHQALTDIRVLETLQASNELEKAQSEEAYVREKAAQAQERAGKARKAAAIAQALHDAARRAAGETLDQRLERVLPLMAELYQRLRPHPVWRDIEYSIRGDVRKFLKLQVGDDLNPQFIFSSGQRRATGLAFLLSVNLSLAWSRWRTIMLDDPVQHVDDFRSIHLAEVAAQLVADGHQIICAVEDVALADLLCRRMPVVAKGDGRRVSVAPNADGDLGVTEVLDLAPLVRRSLAVGAELDRSAAS